MDRVTKTPRGRMMSAAGRLGILVRDGAPPDAVAAGEQELAAARIEVAISEAPPLSPEQVQRLIVALNGGAR